MSLVRILLVAALVTGAAAALGLRSGPEERVAMLVRDGRQAEAVVEIERILATGQAKPRLLMTLAQLEEALGDLTRASAMMDVYVLARPRDRDALAWLMKAYEASDNSAGLAEALTNLTALEPTPERIARLAALHRYEGRFEDECAVLERFAALVPLAPEMLERLGALLAAQGRVPRAIEILREADVRTAGAGEPPRKLLFELLIQSGLYDEAATRAHSWLVRWNKPWIAAQFALRLAAVAPFETGRTLAAAAASLHPDARLYLAKTLAEQGNRRIAATLLLGWPFAGVPLTQVEVEGYVAAIVATGDPGAAWGAFAKLRGQPGTAEAQARFAEAAAAYYGLVSIGMLQPPLPADVLRHRPLFAARLALSRGQDQLARRILASADLGPMAEGERRTWLDLLLRTGSGSEAFAVLNHYQHRQALPAALLPAYRALAVQLGRPLEHEAALRGHHLAGLVP